MCMTPLRASQALPSTPSLMAALPGTRCAAMSQLCRNCVGLVHVCMSEPQLARATVHTAVPVHRVRAGVCG